jgi:hypothetical protein
MRAEGDFQNSLKLAGIAIHALRVLVIKKDFNALTHSRQKGLNAQVSRDLESTAWDRPIN